MGMPIDLLLMRHAQSEGNAAIAAVKKGINVELTPEFLERSSVDWRLTPKGREQAAKTGEWIRKNFPDGFFRYYTSEYVRAMETAALLDLPNASWYTEFYLRERERGKMDPIYRNEVVQEKFAEEIRQKHLDSFYWTPPNGESIADACLRADRILDTLHRECDEEPVIIVCHGEIMWAFRIRLTRMSRNDYILLDRDSEHDIKNGQIYHFTRKHPITGQISPYLSHFRTIDPNGESKLSPEWIEIERKYFSNNELLERAEEVKVLFQG